MQVTAEKTQQIWEQIHAQITAHPETHDQGDFEAPDDGCGTTRCVAGWAVYFFAPGHESIYRAKRQIEAAHYEGRYTHTATMARDILGLDQYAANDLFYDLDDDEAREFVARKAGA